MVPRTRTAPEEPLSPRPSRKEELLDAAIRVIRRDGAQKLTLDAVAAEAGVSKGGILYHFGTKRALVDGLIERWLDDFDRRLQAADGDVPRRVRRVLRPLAPSPSDVAARSSGCSRG